MPLTVGIPATVSFRPTPCTWTLGEDGRFRTDPNKSGLRSGDHPSIVDSTSISFPDAWTVRSRFLGLRDEGDFLRYLNETGLFLRAEIYGSDQSWRLEDFRVWQRTLTDFLRRRPPVWKKRLDFVEQNGEQVMRTVHLHTGYPIEFQWGQGRPSVFVATVTLSAILATVYIDHLRGAKFRLCDRPDCRTLYEIESEHERRYCRKYCAHLES